MPPPHLSLIVAMTPGRVIGRGGALPWRLAADLRRFRRLTMGHHVIMGRRTYESLPSSLPGRHLVVLSRRAGYEIPEGKVVPDWDAALQEVAHDAHPFVIGGAHVFAEALPLVDRLEVTLVHASVEGDTFFPVIDWSEWRLEQDTWHAADARNEFPFSFRSYRRRVGGGDVADSRNDLGEA